MKLQKKSSIWKYIFRTDGFEVFVVLVGVIVHVPVAILIGKIAAALHSPMFRILSKVDTLDSSDLFEMYILGLADAVVIFFLVFIVGLIVSYIPEILCNLSVYKAARYIPLTEEELKTNNIVCVNDLENFLITNVFNNIKHGCYVYEVLKEIRDSYSKVIAIDPDVIKLELNDEEKDRLACRMANDMDDWFGFESDDKLHRFETHLKEIQDDRKDDKE